MISIEGERNYIVWTEEKTEDIQNSVSQNTIFQRFTTGEQHRFQNQPGSTTGHNRLPGSTTPRTDHAARMNRNAKPTGKKYAEGTIYQGIGAKDDSLFKICQSEISRPLATDIIEYGGAMFQSRLERDLSKSEDQPMPDAQEEKREEDEDEEDNEYEPPHKVTKLSQTESTSPRLLTQILSTTSCMIRRRTLSNRTS
jgi:hypothetical protein